MVSKYSEDIDMLVDVLKDILVGAEARRIEVKSVYAYLQTIRKRFQSSSRVIISTKRKELDAMKVIGYYDPAPILAPAPMVMPATITTPVPIKAFFSITTPALTIDPAPIWTKSSMSTSCSIITPEWMIQC